MQPFQVQIYRKYRTYPESAVYVLSRGNNAGRPAYQPNANSYVVMCDPQDRDRYYWLINVLWYNGWFKPYLHGSTVLLIRVKDFTRVLQAARLTNEVADAMIAAVSKIAGHQQEADNIIKFLRELRMATGQTYLPNITTQ